MAWIESHQALVNHPKLLKLKYLTGWSKNEAIGVLHRLWWWALAYCEDGDLSKYSSSEVALALDLPDSFDKSKFFDILIEANFIEKDLKIHDWLDYAGRYLKTKYASSNPAKLINIQKKYKCRKSRTKVKPKSDKNDTPLPTDPSLPTDPNQQTLTTQSFIAKYCQSFKALYGKNPIMMPKDSGIAKRLIEIPNIEKIMELFFKSNDDFILKNCHALNIVESQINKLLNQKKTKKSGIDDWIEEKEKKNGG